MNKKLLKIFSYFIIFLILTSTSIFIYYYFFSPQKSKEYQQELEKITKDIEKLKSFNEEEYAEKITKLTNPESFISTSTDIELEGVEIIKKGDRKLVINHAEGYQIEIPNDWILNRSWYTEQLLFDDLEMIKDEPYGPPKIWQIASILVWDSNEVPKQISHIEEESKVFPIEDVNINGINCKKMTNYFYKESTGTRELIPDYQRGPSSFTTYCLNPKNNKLYEITVPPAERFYEYVKTFKFIE